MRASIDIGSNSILLLIGDFAMGKFTIAVKNAHVTSLGKGIDRTGEFCEQSMADSFNVLKIYAEQCVLHGIAPQNVIVTATEAARVVSNSRAFFAKIKRELGLSVQIITGEGEAYYTSLGVIAGSVEHDFTIMDIGGASTELMCVMASNLSHSISLPIGCVRATEWAQQGIEDQEIERALKKMDWKKFATPRLVCEAGSMTSLAAVYLKLREYSDEKVQGLTLSIDQFEAFSKRINSMTSNELLSDYPFLGKRAQVIQAGARIALRLCQNLGVRELEVSTYGLRYGTLKEGMIQEKFLA